MWGDTSEETVESNQSQRSDADAKQGRRRFIRNTGAVVGGLAMPSLVSDRAAAARYTVTLGEDRTFSPGDFNFERTKFRNDGLILNQGEANTNTSNGIAEAVVDVKAGLGWASYTGMIGPKFKAEGDPGETA